jgi:hypothetical protein
LRRYACRSGLVVDAIANRDDIIQKGHTYDRKQRRLETVDQPQHYPTRFVSPQLELWELDDEQWRKVIERPARQRRQRAGSAPVAEQLGLQLIGLLVVMATLVRVVVQRCAE